MKKLLILLLLTGCTQTGPKFIDCLEPQKGELALDIALEKMENISEVVYRTDFICKEKRPLTNAECYIARIGNKDFGNRGMILLRDQYIGECVIHELYHIELGQKYGYTCNEHSKECGWDYNWLEPLLDEYKEIKDEIK